VLDFEDMRYLPISSTRWSRKLHLYFHKKQIVVNVILSKQIAHFRLFFHIGKLDQGTRSSDIQSFAKKRDMATNDMLFRY
jgi:hypothetical protein